MTEAGEPTYEAGGVRAEAGQVVKLKAEAVDWREVEGQVVALDRAGSVYLAINQTGAALWPAIIEGATRDQLVQILLDTFDVDAPRAAADVEAFVANLGQRRLLEWSG